jgi:hypothetical protein
MGEVDAANFRLAFKGQTRHAVIGIRGLTLRAEERSGKSAAVYKDLLALWKDADPDILVVEQARAESAKQS